MTVCETADGPTQQATAIPSPDTTLNRVLKRISAEVVEGLRHGFFDYRITCETVNQSRRRLQLHAGKTYQFLIPADEC